jgi:serine/threonine-protein kinase RsbW
MIAPSTDSARAEDWREVFLHRVEDMASLLAELSAALAANCYSRRDCMGVRLALEQAILNGIQHGNRNDPAKCVRVSYRVDAEVVLAEIEDEGPGFNADRVPDPTTSENLEKPSGRGLLLIRHYTSWLCYHGRGNCLTFCKYRAP